MTQKSRKFSEEKTNMHSRNPHRFRYDFPKLVEVSPELAGFIFVNEYGNQSVNFTDPEAVKALNKALLKAFYGIAYWDIPEGYLCPPIPGRADYLYYLADLLAADHGGVIPQGKAVKLLDIGTGANCIYPIIGHKAFGWHFVGSETDQLAIRSARNIIEANSLSKFVEIRRQASTNHIFEGIIHKAEIFDLSICNPPFHSSAAEAREGSQRKWKNLGHRLADERLNFGGQSHELWCEGGEESFILKMIRESSRFAANCGWFTTLVSKKTTLEIARKALEQEGALAIKIIDMAQGQKISRLLAWTYMKTTS